MGYLALILTYEDDLYTWTILVDLGYPLVKSQGKWKPCMKTRLTLYSVFSSETGESTWT